MVLMVPKHCNPRRGIERMELTVDEVGCVDRRSGSMLTRLPIHGAQLLKLTLSPVTRSALLKMLLTVDTIRYASTRRVIAGDMEAFVARSRKIGWGLQQKAGRQHSQTSGMFLKN